MSKQLWHDKDPSLLTGSKSRAKADNLQLLLAKWSHLRINETYLAWANTINHYRVFLEMFFLE